MPVFLASSEYDNLSYRYNFLLPFRSHNALSCGDYEDLIRIKSIAREPYIKNALDHDIALGDKIPVKQTPTIIWTEPKGDSQVIDQSLLPYDTWRRNIDRVIK